MELSRARNSIFFHEPPEISIFSSTYRIRTGLIVLWGLELGSKFVSYRILKELKFARIESH